MTKVSIVLTYEVVGSQLAVSNDIIMYGLIIKSC